MLRYSVALCLSCMLVTNMLAYESDDILKISIIEKSLQFISLKSKNSDIVITVLNNSYGDLFEKVFANKQINSKNIKIKYVNDIKNINDTTVLYISNVSSESLSSILEKANNKSILTVSDMRGFAEKGGILQVYIASQRAKLKINLATANKEDIKIKSSLLRIAEVIQKDDL